MKRRGVFAAACLVAAVCLVTVACDRDPARSVKIISRPPASASPVRTFIPASSTTVVVNPSADPDTDWQLESCPPPAENSTGPSNFIANGPCGFRHRRAASCESIADDFIVAVTRPAKLGTTLVVYLNVERYHGPGSYDGAQLFVAVQGGSTIYRWSSETVHATVGPGEAFVELPVTRLEGEAMLVSCTTLIGPATNYQYQCAGIGDAKVAISTTAEVVSGKLQCAAGQKD